MSRGQPIRTRAEYMAALWKPPRLDTESGSAKQARIAYAMGFAAGWSEGGADAKKRWKKKLQKRL